MATPPVLDGMIQGTEGKLISNSGIVQLSANDKLYIINCGATQAKLKSDKVDTSLRHNGVMAGLSILYLGNPLP